MESLQWTILNTCSDDWYVTLSIRRKGQKWSRLIPYPVCLFCYSLLLFYIALRLCVEKEEREARERERERRRLLRNYLNGLATCIQRTYRGWLARRRYYLIRRSVALIKNWWRTRRYVESCWFILLFDLIIRFSLPRCFVLNRGVQRRFSVYVVLFSLAKRSMDRWVMVDTSL
jgi:hypothetical protein